MRPRALDHAAVVLALLLFAGACRTPEEAVPPPQAVEIGRNSVVPRTARAGQRLSLALSILGGSSHEHDHVSIRRSDSPTGEHVIAIDAFERLKPDVHLDESGHDLKTGELAAEIEASWTVAQELPPLPAGTYTLRFNTDARIRQYDLWEKRLTVLPLEDERVPVVNEIENQLARTSVVLLDLARPLVRFAPDHGALLATTTDDRLVVLVGGRNGKDGVGVALSERPDRDALLAGGDAADGGKAGAACGLVSGGFFQALGHGFAGHEARSRSGMPLGLVACAGTGGGDAEAASVPSRDELVASTEALRALERAWESAAPGDRATLVSDFARAHRPSRGVVAWLTEDAKLLVLAGANGTAEHPDGLSIAVAGNPADTIVLAPGAAAPGGKPGEALGPASAIRVEPRR